MLLRNYARNKMLLCIPAITFVRKMNDLTLRNELSFLKNMDPISITGIRVTLGTMTIDEAVQYYEWFWESNPQTMTCRPVTRRTTEDFIAHMQGHFEKGDAIFLAVRRRPDDAFIGRVTLFDRNEANRAIEMGYLIGPAYRGQGYAREAVDLTVRYAFDHLKLNRIIAQTGSFNVRSIALLESLGFLQEGRLREHHMYDGKLHDDLLFGLLASEYKK